MKKTLTTVTLAAFLALTACSSEEPQDKFTPEEEDALRSVQSAFADAPSYEASDTYTSTPADPNAIADGTHRVGVDIQPGTYMNDGSSGTCYWERLSGFSGTAEDIITNANPRGQSFVTIDPSDAAFKSQLCGSWELVE